MRVCGYVGGFYFFQKAAFFRKREKKSGVYISTSQYSGKMNLVFRLRRYIDTKRYIRIFKQFSLISFCFPFQWTINLTKESSIDHIFRSLSQMFCKRSFSDNFAKFTEKHLCRSLVFNKETGWEISYLMNFLKLARASYIRYVIQKLSKSIQISMQTSWDSFMQKTLWKLKRARNFFLGHTFHEILWCEVFLCNII